jgi:hypothetical protein
MTTAAPETPCPDCGKPLPPTAVVCPNCGTNPPPLPVITNVPNPGPGENNRLLTNSCGGEIAAGIVLGVLSPPLITLILSALLDTVRNSVALTSVVVLLFIPLIFGVPLGVAYAIKRKRHVAGNAMQKTLFGWLILFGLLALGLLVICGIGFIKS